MSRTYEEPTPALREGDKVIRYGIDVSGTAWVEEASVSLRPGARLYLIREGGGAVARILYGGNQVIEHDGKSYLAKTAGVTKIIIIPGGYNHDKPQSALKGTFDAVKKWAEEKIKRDGLGTFK